MNYKDTVLDGRYFNTAEVIKYPTAAEWVKASEANPHFFKGDANREAKLTEVYNLAKAEAAEEIAEEEIKSKKRAPRKIAADNTDNADANGGEQPTE